MLSKQCLERTLTPTFALTGLAEMAAVRGSRWQKWLKQSGDTAQRTSDHPSHESNTDKDSNPEDHRNKLTVMTTIDCRRRDSGTFRPDGPPVQNVHVPKAAGCVWVCVRVCIVYMCASENYVYICVCVHVCVRARQILMFCNTTHVHTRT